MSPRVRFSPIDEEIGCDTDETILDAALRQGYELVYGCRTGECGACKAYVLDGEISHEPSSTAALSDAEEASGYALLCRAMPDSDVAVQLLQYDRKDYRLASPIVDGRGTVAGIEPLTRRITRLELQVDEPSSFAFRPGQYVDVRVPGSAERRSFSMSNLPGTARLEFLVERHRDGAFSGLLSNGGLAIGTQLDFRGPYSSLHLRRSGRPVLCVATGAGVGPIQALLRQLAATRTPRAVRFFYGARTRSGLFDVDLVNEVREGIRDFKFVPVLSAPADDDHWSGATGFVHEAVGRFLRVEDLGRFDTYVCGPPEMVDAVAEVLVDGHGVEESDIHYEKFAMAPTARRLTRLKPF